MMLCFVLCPIGAAGSDERRNSDEVYHSLMANALDREKYKIERADLIDRSGIAMNTIFEKIENADLVIADITGGNPNVFYELAIRHATKRPTVVIAQEGTKIPFDINGVNVVFYDISSVSNAFSSARRLKEVSERIFSDNDNPFTLYMASKMMTAGHLPDQGRVAAARDFYLKSRMLTGTEIEKFDGKFLSYKYSIYAHRNEDINLPFIVAPVTFKAKFDHIDLREKSFEDSDWIGFGIATNWNAIFTSHCEGRTDDILAMALAIPDARKPRCLYGAELFVGSMVGRSLFSRPVIYIRYDGGDFEDLEAKAIDLTELPAAAQKFLVSNGKTDLGQLTTGPDGVDLSAILLNAPFGLG